MKDFIELRRIIAILRGHFWLLVGLSTLAALIGLFISRSQTPVYEATTTLLVGQFMQSTSVNRADIQTSTDVARTYADIALRQPILKGVAEALKLDQTWQDLKKQVRVKAIEGTQLLEVTAEATSPATARAIADKVASQLIAVSPTTLENTAADTGYSFIRQQLESLKQRLTDGQKRVQELEAAIAASASPTEVARLREDKRVLEQSITDWVKDYVSLTALASQERPSNNYLTIIEPAQLAKDPVRPRVLLDTIIAGGVGLLLAVALAFFRAYLDSSIRSPEQLQELLGLAPLAEIGTVGRPRWPFLRNTGKDRRGQAAGNNGKSSRMASRKLVILDHPRSPESESFRTLRTNIQFTSPDRPLRSLVVTSAVPMEGKSFVAANLAVVMAQTGKKVVVVDADLRKPTLHTVFGLSNTSGFSNVILSGNAAEYGQQIPEIPTLTVITSGPLPPNPSELLSSKQVKRVMADLAEHADLVIYDSPPAGLVTDPAILGAGVDAVILVARAGATRRSLILNAKQALQNVGVNVILPVLNAVVRQDMTTSDGYYHAYGTLQAEPEDRPTNGHTDLLEREPVLNGQLHAPEREELPGLRTSQLLPLLERTTEHNGT
jgi:non-specific protein-tyrosine kinase